MNQTTQQVSRQKATAVLEFSTSTTRMEHGCATEGVCHVDTKFKGLPTISFIVVNHNYARFIQQCVESVLNQDYPAIECIIVDDASTDNSKEIITGLQKEYPNIKTLFREENGGQSVACAAGFSIATGYFISFVDADDYLLRAFARAHIQTHLSVPNAIGFTSGDMAIAINDETIMSTYLEALYPRSPHFMKIPQERLKDLTQVSTSSKSFFEKKCSHYLW